MTNKEVIQNKLIELGYKLGCYNETIEELSNKELQKVIADLKYEHEDIKVKIGRKNYIVEIATVDYEKDLNIMTITEYKNLYGDNEG